MDFEAIKAWLARQTNKQIQIRWLCALLGIVLTPVGLAIGVVLIFAIARLSARHSANPGIDAKCAWIALCSLPVLFIINFFTPRNTGPEKYYHDDPDTSLVGGYVTRRKVQARVFLWLLFTGPRLVDWVISSFRRIYRLKKQDTHGCAAVLWLLMVKGKRVAYTDIQRELDWLDVEATAPQLAWIPGVFYIRTGPPAVSLSEDLRTAIRSGAAVL
jgi:hypothetical protein